MDQRAALSIALPQFDSFIVGQTENGVTHKIRAVVEICFELCGKHVIQAYTYSEFQLSRIAAIFTQMVAAHNVLLHIRCLYTISKLEELRILQHESSPTI